MPIRKLNLPKDFEELASMLTDSFQYPENPEWSIQEDEEEAIVESLQSMQRSWWMIQLGQKFIPSMRNLLDGFVWEEDGKIVSTVTIDQRGSSNNWLIGTVATLPEYRRRGYARKMLHGALDLLQERGAEIAVLDVIESNFPAYTLYQNMGFEHFSGKYELEFKPSGITPKPDWPTEITLETSKLFNWQPRFQLAKRIRPENLQKYEPTQEALFKPPAFMKVFYPILQKMQKIKSEMIFIHHNETNQIIGFISLDIPTNHKGRNNIYIQLDPAFAAYSKTIIQHALHMVTTIDPELMIEMSIFTWQQHIIDAALAMGFSKRVQYHRMGIKL